MTRTPIEQAPPGDAASVRDAVSRLSELTALVVTVAYGLGLLELLGQLRRLDLHQPAVISGFAHDDVLVKGVGVLIQHVPSLLSVAMVLSLALSPPLRAVARRSVGTRLGGAGARDVRVVAFQLGYVALALVSALLAAWWEGTLVVGLLWCYVAVAWRSPALFGRRALLVTAGVGALLLGATGGYLHPEPLPRVEIGLEKGPDLEGELLGTGQRGEWYVVEGSGRSRVLSLVPDRDAARVDLSEPTGDAPRRLLDVLQGE